MAGYQGIEIQDLRPLVIGVLLERQIKNGVGFVDSAEQHQHECEFIGNGERCRIAVQSFAENPGCIFESRSAGQCDSEIETLQWRSLDRVRFIEESDDSAVVFLLNERLRELIERHG